MSLSVSLTSLTVQRAKKAESDRPGLVYFSVLNLPNGQVKVFRGIQITEELEQILLIKIFFRQVEKTFGLVRATATACPSGKL